VLEAIKRLIESLEFLDRDRKSPKDFTREMKMPFKKLVYFLLSMMNLLALKGEVSCKRYIIYEVRSVRKFIDCRVYYQIFVNVTNSNRPEGRGIRPYCE
jgi:hypothetical protein